MAVNYWSLRNVQQTSTKKDKTCLLFSFSLKILLQNVHTKKWKSLKRSSIEVSKFSNSDLNQKGWIVFIVFPSLSQKIGFISYDIVLSHQGFSFQQVYWTHSCELTLYYLPPLCASDAREDIYEQYDTQYWMCHLSHNLHKHFYYF